MSKHIKYIMVFVVALSVLSGCFREEKVLKNGTTQEPKDEKEARENIPVFPITLKELEKNVKDKRTKVSISKGRLDGKRSGLEDIIISSDEKDGFKEITGITYRIETKERLSLEEQKEVLKFVNDSLSKDYHFTEEEFKYLLSLKQDLKAETMFYKYIENSNKTAVIGVGYDVGRKDGQFSAIQFNVYPNKKGGYFRENEVFEKE